MPWLQLTFHSHPDEADRLVDALNELDADAVTMQDDADEPLYEPPPGATPLWRDTRVTALFPADTDSTALLLKLSTALAPHALPACEETQLEDQDWERAWMDDFKPMRFGQRLWIVPSWHEAPEQDAVNILLDPGLAFGTGTHPTTHLCLNWLDSEALRNQQVIDYGCGSGILAIAAALLGAKSVWAVDNDPQALIATRDNAERNGVADKIHACLPDALPAMQADTLIANILAQPLIDLSTHLASLVRPGARIALSGILADQANMVANAYQDAFDMQPATELDGWIRLEGTRK